MDRCGLLDVLGFDLLRFGLDPDACDGRFLHSTNLVNLESNNKNLPEEDLNICKTIRKKTRTMRTQEE
jgi:hypothetical protein